MRVPRRWPPRIGSGPTAIPRPRSRARWRWCWTTPTEASDLVTRGDDVSAEIPPRVERTLSIAATPAVVWRALTEPALMCQWMGEPEMQIEVDTDWTVGGPLVVRGFHHVRFEGRGTVRAFEPERALEYTQLSSVSRLPDVPESHHVIGFAL